MNWIFILLIGFAIGVEVGRMQKGQKCDWKQGLLVGGIALVVAAGVVAIIAWLR